MGTLHQFKKEQDAIQQTGRVLTIHTLIHQVYMCYNRISVDRRLNRNWKGKLKWNEKKQPKHVRTFISNVVISRMR